MKLNAKRFRVKNYRNIDDSGWIPLEKVTALVGRNEAGKTTLLKALHYDGHCNIEYNTEITDDPVDPAELVAGLNEFAKGARRIAASDPGQEEDVQSLRTTLANWAGEKKASVAELQDLRTERGVELISLVQQEVNGYAQPLSADLVESLLGVVDDILRRVQTAPLSRQIDKAVEAELPVFIYFENYGILDSAVYLPRFLEDRGVTPDNPRVSPRSGPYARDVNRAGAATLKNSRHWCKKLPGATTWPL